MKIIVAGVVVGVVAGIAFYLGGLGPKAKLAQAQAAWQTERTNAAEAHAKALSDAREKELAWQKAAHDAEVKNEAERKKIQLAAAGTDRALTGLRHELATTRKRLSAAPPPPVSRWALPPSMSLEAAQENIETWQRALQAVPPN